MKTARREQRIIDFLESRGAMSVEELSGLLGVSVSTLRKQLAEAECAGDALRKELEEMRRSREEAEGRLAEETAVRAALEPVQREAEQLRREIAALQAENEKLLPDAQAYAQFRERIGAIECEARKRAADLEEATCAQLRQTVDQFRRQYQILMSTFETTASHVNSELRKVEVNLTQLPRAMDQSGVELNELAAMLERKLEK